MSSVLQERRFSPLTLRVSVSLFESNVENTFNIAHNTNDRAIFRNNSKRF